MKLQTPARIIKLGYWQTIDRFEKIECPLLEIYHDNNATILFQLTIQDHGKIDPEHTPLDITDLDFALMIKQVYWDEFPVNAPAPPPLAPELPVNGIFLSTEDGTLVKENPTMGLLKAKLSVEQINSLSPGHHPMYLGLQAEDHPIFNNSIRTILKDFIDILQY